MNEKLREQVFSKFDLTAEQRNAAIERERDVVVTAGAGSGKTRTLVARFVSCLADGYPLRSVVAITFTEKAAREMRSRIRQTLIDLANAAEDSGERIFWGNLNTKMDAARIGTIHSLCAEILRAHPAEAGVDPKFEVLDEGLAAALKMQIVEESMARLVSVAEFTPLLRQLETRDLRKLLSFLLEKRLEAEESFEQAIDYQQVVRDKLNELTHHPLILNCIREFSSMTSEERLTDAGDKLAAQIEQLFSIWDQMDAALQSGDVVACAGFLHQARREAMDKRPGKKNSALKAAMALLQDTYDRILDPICGGKNSDSKPPTAEGEQNFKLFSQLINPAAELLFSAYKKAMRQNGTLDFDDLEKGASTLLKTPAIQQHWQNEVAAIMVDEFQDTNQRQREMVEALAGAPGKLFVVGDLKQSIYRFRRADVTVFRFIRKRVKDEGGLIIDLDENFRTHEPLMNAMGDLLQRVMVSEDEPEPPYFVGYEAMIAHRKEPPNHLQAPHLEFVLGSGESTEDARPNAATALAYRLIELKQEGQIQNWEDVTLLFRASTGFSEYENAFEDANIPFVTVAGRGFYDRPEIRDVLNILRALADPSDDLAMAGLLRSPAFGLSDAALYQLRWQEGNAQHFMNALKADTSHLSPTDQPRAERAARIINNLQPLVDRIPVAELLKRLVDATDYRTILSIEDISGTGGRLWRNLDKLILDAQASGKVNVRDFLDYLVTLDDAGAREGEASAEAQGSVRLMTIHRSKGLQFPIVVLADTNREPRGGSDLAFLLPEFGLTCKLDPEPLIHRMAKAQNKAEKEAENLRVLYVAMTRTMEKLLINGFLTQTAKGIWKADAWFDELIHAANIDLGDVAQQAGEPLLGTLINGEPVRAWMIPPLSRIQPLEVTSPQALQQNEAVIPLYIPIENQENLINTEDEPEELRTWRATSTVRQIPPTVVGRMVHKVLQCWCLPGHPNLSSLLETTARNEGLAQTEQLATAIQEATHLLTRFSEHPLRQEIEIALERHQEVPYTYVAGKYAESGYIDLLYRTPAGWQIIDFKTDAIHSDQQRNALMTEYQKQLIRYKNAVTKLLNTIPHARICFLDDQGEVSLMSMNSNF